MRQHVTRGLRGVESVLLILLLLLLLLLLLSKVDSLLALGKNLLANVAQLKNEIVNGDWRISLLN